MTHTILSVEGMSCEACRAAVQKALELPQVQRVDVSLETGIVGIAHGDNVSADSLASAVEEAGYEVREARSG
jgi:copper chaperone